MSVLKRRALFASLGAAALQGCASQRSSFSDQTASQIKNACDQLNKDYPTPQEIAEQFRPSFSDILFAKSTMDNYITDVRGENNVQGLSLDQAIRSGSSPTTGFVTREMLKADILKSPWIITIESLALPFGYNHLSVTLRSEKLQILYLRTEGLAAKPKRYYTRIYSPMSVVKIGDTVITLTSPVQDKYFEVNAKAISFMGNDTLFGVIDNQALPQKRDRKVVASFTIDYPTSVNFISRLSQFLVAFDSTATPYKLWEQNSNSFAYSVLKHGLGENFPEEALSGVLSTPGLKVPGYGKDVLPEFQPNPAFQLRNGETVRDVLRRIFKSHPTTDKCQSDAQANLTIGHLMLMAELFEPALELPAVLTHQNQASRPMPFGVTVISQQNITSSGSNVSLTSPHP